MSDGLTELETAQNPVKNRMKETSDISGERLPNDDARRYCDCRDETYCHTRGAGLGRWRDRLVVFVLIKGSQRNHWELYFVC